MTVEALFRFTVFGSTAFVLALHPLEWFKVKNYLRVRRDELRSDKGLDFLKCSLGLESCYYLFVLGFLVAFYREPFLLAFVLVMIVVHVAARRNMSQAHSALRDSKHLAGMLAFDILELIFLVLLMFEFWPVIAGTV